MSPTQRFLVSTDLDGTLLDHHNYNWRAANDALSFLKNNQIPVIFNTSKTLAEAIALQKAIGVDGPIIVENGSALAIPKQDLVLINACEGETIRNEEKHVLVEFGKNRPYILEFIQSQRLQLGDILSGYHDWDVDEIIHKTGLKKTDALLSAQKLFSEPFVWQADEAILETFIHNANAEGFKVTQGGRFFHIQGDTNKAKPIVWLKSQLQKAHNNMRYTLICLGDNANDVAMLNAADIPVCVRSPTANYPQIRANSKTIKTKALGPEGWQEAMSIIFPASGL